MLDANDTHAKLHEAIVESGRPRSYSHYDQHPRVRETSRVKPLGLSIDLEVIVK